MSEGIDKPDAGGVPKPGRGAKSAGGGKPATGAKPAADARATAGTNAKASGVAGRTSARKPAAKKPSPVQKPSAAAKKPSAPAKSSATKKADAVEESPSTATAASVTVDRPTGLALLLKVTRPRRSRGQLVVALLCGLLGFALVTQVHSEAGVGLSSARQSDLVDVLDSLSAKSDQLRSQITDEQDALSKLTGGTDQTKAALDEAQQRAATLRILAGTVGASGPGIDLRIDDPDHKITADVLLDTLEELRDAGAEAIEIRGAPALTDSATGASPGTPLAVRLVASSYFVDSQDGRGVIVDGTLLSPPYDLLAIGDPPTLDQAMGIPGGVVDTVKGKDANVTVTELDDVRVTALHPLTSPKYARPVASPSTG